MEQYISLTTNQPYKSAAAAISLAEQGLGCSPFFTEERNFCGIQKKKTRKGD